MEIRSNRVKSRGLLEPQPERDSPPIRSRRASASMRVVASGKQTCGIPRARPRLSFRTFSGSRSGDVSRWLGGGKSRLARARIRPRLRERSPTPFAYQPLLLQTTLHMNCMRSGRRVNATVSVVVIGIANARLHVVFPPAGNVGKQGRVRLGRGLSGGDQWRWPAQRGRPAGAAQGRKEGRRGAER